MNTETPQPSQTDLRSAQTANYSLSSLSVPGWLREFTLERSQRSALRAIRGAGLSAWSIEPNASLIRMDGGEVSISFRTSASKGEAWMEATTPHGSFALRRDHWASPRVQKLVESRFETYRGRLCHESSGAVEQLLQGVIPTNPVLWVFEGQTKNSETYSTGGRRDHCTTVYSASLSSECQLFVSLAQTRDFISAQEARRDRIRYIEGRAAQDTPPEPIPFIPLVPGLMPLHKAVMPTNPDSPMDCGWHESDTYSIRGVSPLLDQLHRAFGMATGPVLTIFDRVKGAQLLKIASTRACRVTQGHQGALS